MTRPLRIQAPGIYHITDRGTGPCTIFRRDADRESMLGFFATVLREFRWTCHMICLLGTHQHMLIETVEENLAQGMQRLKGLFAQAFNRRHGRSGALFQGRYGSVPVETEAHLFRCIRYIALNPVVAGLCESAADWRWGSYAVLLGTAPPFPFPVGEKMLPLFGKDRASAIAGLRAFVEESF